MDLDAKIREIEKFHSKTLEGAKKTFKKALSDINENIPKLKAGAKQLEEEEGKKMAKGVEAAARVSKMQFRATKALGEFSRFLQDELEQYPPAINIKEVDSWDFEQMKSWLRGYNKLINSLDEKRRVANAVMGLDFILKRRVTETPLNKLVEARDILRALLGNEMQIKKILEDLYRLKNEINDNASRIGLLRSELSTYQQNVTELQAQKQHLQSEIDQMENVGSVKEYRDLKVRHQSSELEIGHQINPFKKTFRHISSKASELVGIGPFEQSAARQYEDDSVKTFHDDASNNFQMLGLLCEALIRNENELKIKTTLAHRAKQLEESIAKGKLKAMKLESDQALESLKAMGQDQALATSLEILDEKRVQIEHLAKNIQKTQESIDSSNTNISQALENEEVRAKRFEELLQQAMSPPSEESG